jgi:hypothetical protein
MPARNNRGTITILDVTRTAVAIERLDKHVAAETNSSNNRRAVFSVRSVPEVIKRKIYRLNQLSFETPSCQDMSLEAGELN